MAFTESDRVLIRAYLGAGALYLQLFPKLENAITAIQSVTDGGTRPDNTTELYIKSILTQVQAIDTKLTNLHCQVQVVEANSKEIVLNVVQGITLLRSEGRRLIGIISRTLSCAPMYDYFSAQSPSSSDFVDIYGK